MSKVILAEQVKDNFTQEQADSMYIQITNGATTTLASSLQVSGINNIEFTEEGGDPITASNVSYSNTTSGMTSGNVQNAIDELFQSVSEGAGTGSGRDDTNQYIDEWDGACYYYIPA